MTASILTDLFVKGALKKTHTLVIQWDGASENVAKTNWRFIVWILMRKTGLRKVICSRLEVGHTHFNVDQHHAVFSMHVRGRKNAGSVRKDVHSLGT